MIHRRPAYRPFGAFRFALAMMVLLQHGLVLLAPGGRAVFYALELGSVAVSTFFALSGFVVAEATSSFYRARPAAFLANRMLRLVPPYLAALALSIALDAALSAAGRLVPLDAPLLGSPLQPRVILAALLEILPGLPARRISLQDFSFVPFAWTLRVECAFYLAAFATCWLAALQGGQTTPARPTPARLIAVSLAAAYAAFGLFAWRHWHAPGGGAMQLLCVPFFTFGIGVFLAERRPGAASLCHLLLAAFCVPLAFIFWRQRGHPMLGFQLPLVAVLCGVLLVLSRITTMPGWVRRWDRRMGALSYPLYIGHGIVLTAMSSLSGRRGALPYGAAILAALGLAAVLHAGIERPLRGARNRLRGSQV